MKKTFINKLHFSFVFLALITLTTSIVLNFTFNTTFAAGGNKNPITDIGTTNDSIIKVIATSDLHGQFRKDANNISLKIGGQSLSSRMSHKSNALDLVTDVKEYINAQRNAYGKDSIFVVDLGDIFSNTNKATYDKIEDYLFIKEGIENIIPIYNDIGYDYIVPGNHEGIRYLDNKLAAEIFNDKTNTKINDITFDKADQVINDTRAEKFFLPASILYNMFVDNYYNDGHQILTKTKILSANMKQLDIGILDDNTSFGTLTLQYPSKDKYKPNKKTLSDQTPKKYTWLYDASTKTSQMKDLDWVRNFLSPKYYKNGNKTLDDNNNFKFSGTFLPKAFRSTYDKTSDFIKKYVDSYFIKEVGNLKICFVGLTTKEIQALYSSSAAQGLSFNFDKALQAELKNLIDQKGQSFDYLIALTHIDDIGRHNGVNQTTISELSSLNLLKGFDFIFNGHQHGHGATSSGYNTEWAQASRSLGSILDATIKKSPNTSLPELSYNKNVKYVSKETINKHIPFKVEIYEPDEHGQYNTSPNVTHIAESSSATVTLENLTSIFYPQNANGSTKNDYAIDKSRTNLDDTNIHINNDGSSVFKLYYKKTASQQCELQLNIYYEDPNQPYTYPQKPDDTLTFTNTNTKQYFNVGDTITIHDIVNNKYFNFEPKGGYAINTDGKYKTPSTDQVTFADSNPKTMNIYCHWDKVNVEFNDGSNDEAFITEASLKAHENDNKLHNRGETIKLPKCNFQTINDGYQFAGWKSSSGRTHSAGESYTLSTRQKVTFTAQWVKPAINREYTVKVYLQNLNDTSYQSPKTYKLSKKIPANQNLENITILGSDKLINLPGFTINKKSTTTTTVYRDGTAPKDINIYLDRKEYDVVFDPNGGQCAPVPTDKYKYGATITLPTPDRQGYIFVMWYPSYDTNQCYRSGEIITINDAVIKNIKNGNTIKFIAKWKEIEAGKVQYRINILKEKLEAHDDDDDKDKYVTHFTTLGESTDGATVHYKLDDCTKDDKNPGKGFVYDGSKSTDTINNLTSTKKEEITLYFNRERYNVTFDLDGGKGDNIPKDGEYKYESQIFLPPLSRKNYEFLGWESNHSVHAIPANTLVKIEAPTTFTAKWKKLSDIERHYSVHIYLQKLPPYTPYTEYELKTDIDQTVYLDPSESSKDIQYSFDDYESISGVKSITGFVRNTSKSTQKITVTRYGKSPNINLYYDRAEYKVTFNLDNGYDGPKSGNYKYETTITLTQPYKTDYTFINWVDSNNKEYNANDKVTVNKATTFTAIWNYNGSSSGGGGSYSGGGSSGGGGGSSGGSSSSGSSSSSSSTTTSNATNTAPTTNVPVAITYEFKADRKEAIDVFAVYKDYINQSFNTANITDKNNKAIVFKTNNVTADGKKDNLAIWTFELKTLDNNFAQIYKERIDLEQKVNAGTASEAEKANLDSVKKQLNEYNFKLSVSTSKFDEKNTVPEKIAPLFKGKDALLVDFTQNGKFPGQAIVDLNLGKEYANKEFYVYYLHTDANSKKSTIQLIGENVKVAANGYVRFRSNHGANYIFTPKGKLPNSNAAKQLADQAKNAL